MKLLLHTCCGPCTVYPLRILREAGHEVMGYFYPHNIHPYTECVKRRDTLAQWAEAQQFKVIYQEGYDLEGFIRNAAFRETERCRFCYHERLKSAALIAKKGKFEAFSTTLLYSKFQRHELIRSIGEAVAHCVGIEFYYEDFRIGWKDGVTVSKSLGMYRQQYCGCIYSEKDRFYKPGNGSIRKD
jgi:epoxyqueuosine reductase